MNITQIVESIGESLPIESVNDLPMIRQALNDAVDAAVKGGEMTEAKANDLDQDWAVARVRDIVRRENIVESYEN